MMNTLDSAGAAQAVTDAFNMGLKTFVIGMGTSGKRETAVEMPTGSFILIPALTQHYVFAKGVTITQVHGMGPTGIAYVNPADDPSKGQAGPAPKKKAAAPKK